MQNDESIKPLTAKELGYGQKLIDKELKDNLKSAIFGGYSKKSVSSYVEKLKDTIEQMYENMEQQVNDLVREKTELSQEIMLLRQQYQETELLVKKNQEQVYRLKEECNQLKEENENYNKMEELLRVRMEEQDKLFDERRSLKVKLRDMEKETEQLEAELSEKQRLYEVLEKRLSEAEPLPPQILESNQDYIQNDLLVKVAQLESEKNKLEIQLKEYQGKALEISTGVHETEIEQISWQLEESRDALEFQKGKYRELEAENKMLQMQSWEAVLKQEESEKEKIKNEALNQKIYKLEMEKNGAVETLATMKEQLREMMDREKKDSKEVEKEKAAYEQLQQKFNQLYQQAQELRMHLKGLERERRASDTVLEKYQRQETEYILLKQNNESYLEEISNLEESIQFMFEQMNQQSDAFMNLNERYEESNRKLQNLIREKTEMQLRNVEMIEQINRQVNEKVKEVEESRKITEEKKENKEEEDDHKWDLFELRGSGFIQGNNDKTLNIDEIKKRSMEMTGELKERLNKQIGGV